jgi:hypothetical protein
MDKQKLFEYIRGEDVVIWAGAGFSKYAGYPLGGQLCDLLYERLSDSEKRLVNPQMPLDVLSEEFVRLKDGDRTLLNEILEEVFLKVPKDTTQHELLAKIPHIKNIITTNYDELFEFSYRDGYTLLVKDQDVTKMQQNKVNIIKIHGDLSVPESIVLTKSDYSKFYYENKAAPLQALITELISSKVVLFIGYGYEDPNVWGMFDHAVSFIKDHRKEAYCIAPSLAPHKIKYLKSVGITYIDDTAEGFLNELHANIRENIFGDFPEKKVNPETFRRFLNQHNINPGLMGDEAGFRINSLNGLNSKLKGYLSFSIDKESDVPKQFADFFDKGSIEALELSEEKVSGLKVYMEGLDLYPGMDIIKIIFKKKPKGIYEYDLVFAEAGFEINGLKADLYSGSKQAQIKTVVHNFTLEITIERMVDLHVDINYKVKDSCAHRTIKEALEAYRFAELLFSGELFSIHFKDAEGFSKRLDNIVPEKVKNAKRFIAYLKKLKRVEQAFQIRFVDFTIPNGDQEQVLKKLIRIIENKFVPIHSPYIDLKMEEIYPEALELLRELNAGEHSIDIPLVIRQEFILHGFRFQIEQLALKVPSANVMNLTELESGMTREIKLVSRSGQLQEFYTLENVVVEKIVSML